MRTPLNLILPVLLALVSIHVVIAQENTIVDVAAANEDFSILASLLDAAGLTETLSGEETFTVFAPTNDAFAEFPQFVVDFLLANPDLLTSVLTYHVVEGAVNSGDLVSGEIATLDMGNPLFINTLDNGVQVNNAAVINADIAASNGVIHAIDTLLIPPVELPTVDPLSVTDNIVIAGSSTVFPLTERVADIFNQEGFGGTITVDSIGSGAGFERFCPNAETDISNASRPIRPEEVEACRANGREPFGLFIAVDALAIAVNSENDFVDNLTLEQLALIFSSEARTWDQVNPEWPAEEIRLFSPGSDSGTYDYFIEEIFDEDETFIQNAIGIQFSEDDNVLVQGVEGSPFAIGYFGFAFFQENQDTLRVIPIEGVEPNEETGASGEYPLSRPLFIYSAPSILEEKPQVAAFMNFYIQNANPQLGTASDQIGYIPTNDFVFRRNALSLLAAMGAE